ncbi:unnamed protein product [Umbelopsis sp. WA50703]
MSVAYFKLVYQAERSSVSISVEDAIPKPFLKVGDRNFELNCYLKQSTNLQYQIFEDDEPQQWGYIDTSAQASACGIIDMQASNSPSQMKATKPKVLGPFNILPKLSSIQTMAMVYQVMPSNGSPPDLGHSDTETDTSELDAPLTPAKNKAFPEENDNLCSYEDNDIKSISHKSLECVMLPGTVCTNQAVEQFNTNSQKDNASSEMNIGIHELPVSSLKKDSIKLPPSTDCQDFQEVSLPVGSKHANKQDDDEFDDRCVVDDMVAEMQDSISAITEPEQKSMSSQQGQMTTQHMSKMNTSDLLGLESMFASFVMVIILQVFANALSFTKAYTN